MWQNRSTIEAPDRPRRRTTMPIVRHADPDDFLAASAPALAHNAAAASLFRAIALGVKRRPPAPDERVYLATLHQGGAVAAAVQRADHGLMVEAAEPGLAAFFADDIADEHPALQGVGGVLAACEAFARRWRERTARAHVMRMHLRHHILTEVAPVPGALGRMRAATDADLDWLLDASLAFVAEARMPDSPAQVRRSVPLLHAQARYRIWDDGGRAAFAGWSDAGEGARARSARCTHCRRCASTVMRPTLVAALSCELYRRRPGGACSSPPMSPIPRPMRSMRASVIAAYSHFYHFDFRRATARVDAQMSAARGRSHERTPAVCRGPGAELAAGRELALPAAAAHHALYALRLRDRRRVTLFTGAGGEFAATLVRVDRRGVMVHVDRVRRRRARSDAGGPRWCRAIAASDAMDYAIRKAVELGVSAVQPVTTRAQRTVSGGRARRQRHAALAPDRHGGLRAMRPQSAARPARGRCPRRMARARDATPAGHRARAGRRTSLPQLSAAGVARHPDRSRRRFHRGRICTARRARVSRRCALGPRILRTETASLAALAAINTLWGDFR